jgi:ABC-type Co2+ transport system permease subunit
MLLSPVPMHIPDGFLSVAVSLVLWAIFAGRGRLRAQARQRGRG